MGQVDLKEGMIVNLVKVSEKDAITTADSTDVLPITDADGNMSKITVDNLLSPVSGGVGNAVTSTVPAAGVNTYNVQGGAGTYTNFLAALSTPIVFDNVTDAMTTKNWQMRKVGTYWQKYEIKYASLSNYALNGGSTKTLKEVDDVVVAIDERTQNLIDLYPDKTYVVDDDGNVGSVQNEDGFFSENIIQQRDDIDDLQSDVAFLQQQNYYLGSTCRIQKNRGKYYFPTAVSAVGSNVSVVKNSSITKWAPKYCYDARYSGSDTINISIGAVITGATNVGINWFLPYEYNQGNIDYMTVSLTLSGTVVGTLPPDYIQYDDQQTTGYALHKWLLTQFGSPVSFDGIRITFALTVGASNIGNYKARLYIDSIVIDQMLEPCFSLVYDKDSWDKNYANGIWQKHKDNNFPLMVIDKTINEYSGAAADMLYLQKLVKDRLAAVGVYTDGMKDLTSYSAMTAFIKPYMDQANNKALTKVITIGCQHNATNLMMIGALKEVGAKMVRGPGNAYTHYIDDFTLYGCRAFYSQPTNTLTQEDNLIAAAKAYIDRCIAIGAFGSIITHGVMPLAEIPSSNDLHHSLYVWTNIMDYLIAKALAGEIRLVDPASLYYAATGYSNE